MAKTNTDARWLPGANMEQSADRIRDILMALSGMLQNYSADEVRGLIQSIVDLMAGDDGESIGQQLTNAINDKVSNADLNNLVQSLTNSIASVDNKKVDKTDFNFYRNTTADTISIMQSCITANTNSLSALQNNLTTELENANSAITKLESTEKDKLICLNGHTKFIGGQAFSLVNKLSSCLILAEKNCPEGLLVTDSQNVSMTGNDKNGDAVPLYDGHLYVFSYIVHSGSDDELRLTADIPINTEGRHWLSGSEISHLANAKEYAVEGKLGDMYLNVETLRIYRCVGLSNNNLYEWEYVGQWSKTSDIKMINLSTELQNIISNKAEKSTVDEISKTVQSLISHSGGGTSGGTGGAGIVDTAFDDLSSNAIANWVVTEAIDLANDERNGLAYAIGSLLGIDRVPQLYVSDMGDSNIVLLDFERVSSKINLLPHIRLNATEFVTINGTRIKSKQQEFELYPNDGEWREELYYIDMTISQSEEISISVHTDESGTSDTKLSNLIGSYNSSTGDCTIRIGWVQVDRTGEGWGVAASCFYNISGAVFLSDVDISNNTDIPNIIGSLSSLNTDDKTSIVSAINEVNSQATMAVDTASSKLDAVFVEELPTSNAKYTFDTDPAFTVIERGTTTINTENGEKYLTVTSASNAGNKYGLANLDFSSISENATSVVIEMDFRIPGGRWYIGYVDLSKRPGDSQGISYNTDGVAFYHGTKDGTSYQIFGATSSAVQCLNTWVSIKAVINIVDQQIDYEVKDRDSGSVLLSGNIGFMDEDTRKITGIELYTWTETSIDIDNVSVSANIDVNDNSLYVVERNKRYDMFMYKNGEPRLLSASKNYSQIPQRVGTWVDGTPVWRVGIPITTIEDIGCTNPTERWFVDVLDILTKLNITKYNSPVVYLDDKLVFQNDDAYNIEDFADNVSIDTPGRYEFSKSDGDYATHFYGWIEFATPESNIITQS